MGPGWVPRALACAILAAGMVQLGAGVTAAARAIPAFGWRQLIAITLAGAAFAIALPLLGLVAAVIAAMVVAAAAAPPLRPLECLVAALVVAAFSTLLFVKALGLPFKVWPW